jgi:hypothetical protein
MLWKLLERDLPGRGRVRRIISGGDKGPGTTGLHEYQGIVFDPSHPYSSVVLIQDPAFIWRMALQSPDGSTFTLVMRSR